MGVQIPPGLPFLIFWESRVREKIRQLVEFLKEVRSETKRVSWVSRKQVLGATLVVLILVIIMAIYLGIIDLIIAAFMKAVLG
jgi:preprotein translocase subunit SecE